jgi:hypothetical protein
MPPKIPKKQSALDLSIKGSMGDFSVSQGDASSIRVHYLLSHIGLELEGDHQERLLSKLAPFREVFDTRSLDFDQIMQRDIDDSRVSTELIPYILEPGNSGLVKLFPPIIVVVLPTDNTGKPAPYYPTVQSLQTTEDETEYHSLRSGEPGQEVFELRQWLIDNEPQAHDFAELKINTNRCKLVIVDGQHRAMSLLALYRNIKGWPERTRTVEPYYKIWTPARIASFNLSRARLPIMFCVFPQLDGTQHAELPVHTACRSIFLALNKNARAVTRSRNILLDDRDVVASLIRIFLGYIKDRNIESQELIRLWAIELDNDKDRSVLVSPMAITGVTHLNGLLERLMLAQPPQPGLTVRTQNLSLAKKLDRCFARLNIRELLPQDIEKTARRDACDPNTLSIIEGAFAEVYLKALVSGYNSFAPYLVHHKATQKLHLKLQTGVTADFYRAILFEGEGMNRVFSDFQEQLDSLLQQELFATPELRQTRDEFRNREANLKKEVEEFQKNRALSLLSGTPKELQENLELQRWITESLYPQTLTTAAFQNALFLTFFGIIEQINSDRSKPPELKEPLTDEEVLSLFAGYLEDLNRFFLPKGKDGLLNLLWVFFGELVSPKPASECEVADNRTKVEPTIVPSKHALRHILLPTELKPDEWPKFRAILQELWRPKDVEVKALLNRHRKGVRQHALDRYIDREVKEHCRDKGIREVDVKPEDRVKIEEKCASYMEKGLAALGVKIKAENLLETVQQGPPILGEE